MKLFNFMIAIFVMAIESLGLSLRTPVRFVTIKGVPHWLYADGTRLPMMAGGSTDTKELRSKRGQLITEARSILDKSEAEKREISAEEETRWNTLLAESDKLEDQIKREERQAEEDRKLGQSQGHQTQPNPAEGGDPEKRTISRRATPEYLSAFRTFLVGGVSALTAVEQRALQMDLDTSGGYLVAPEQFVTELLKDVDNAVFIRRLATVRTLVNAESLGVPTLDANPADADWTSELAVGSEDSTMAFGKRELSPKPLAKLLKVSNKLLRASALNPESLVRERLAYVFGISEEQAFMTGSGAGQPLGVFTASAQGISTGRDVSTGNTGTSIQTDGLIEAKHTLKGQYWPRARWIFHRDAIKQIRKLKDGNGQYLWQPGISSDLPSSILEVPYFMSEYAPNTFTTGLYVGLIGDFSMYWIADALDMQIQRLVELYAATNQTGFIGRLETDGMPVMENAFVRVKLA